MMINMFTRITVTMMTDQRPLWREYIENEKEKLLEKAE